MLTLTLLWEEVGIGFLLFVEVWREVGYYSPLTISYLWEVNPWTDWYRHGWISW